MSDDDQKQLCELLDGKTAVEAYVLGQQDERKYVQAHLLRHSLQRHVEGHGEMWACFVGLEAEIAGEAHLRERDWTADPVTDAEVYLWRGMLRAGAVAIEG